MDGNGRWAEKRGLPRWAGHKQGVAALRRAVRAAIELGVKMLIVYAFSSENWGRPGAEVSYLMGLAKKVFRDDIRQMHKNGVRVRVIGGRDDLEPELVRMIEDAEELTKDNSALTLAIAFNYGGRQEMVRTMRRIALRVELNEIKSDQIDLGVLESHLDTTGLPFPDLIVRTAGDQRLSNFLLFQAAYAQLLFIDKLWPDFGRKDLEAAIEWFGNCKLNFGVRKEA